MYSINIESPFREAASKKNEIKTTNRLISETIIGTLLFRPKVDSKVDSYC